MIAQTSTNKDGEKVYRYAETNLIFTIAEDEKLVHCFDIDEPQTDLLKFVLSMSAVLESFGVSIKDFKKDFGGRGLSLSDRHNMHDIEIDNGAFTVWKAAGKNKIDWQDYYAFVKRWKNHPGFDFAIIPDVIDGGAEENDALLAEWPHGSFVGVPVWHMNESDDRFIQLCNEYPRVAIGSCGEYDVKSPLKALARLKDIIRHVVDSHGQPITKLHGLRMLNPTIFTRLPLASADSTNVAQNIGKDVNWKGTYQPHSKETRATIMVERIESHNSSGTLDYCEKRDHFSVQLGLEV